MLKPVEELTQPDPLVATTSGQGGSQPLTVKEHHEAVAEIRLVASIDKPVHVAFDRARNAFLYAWFSYDLGALAEAQALFSVELALRSRLKTESEDVRGLSNLIGKAIKLGLIRENPQGTPSKAMVFRMMRNEWAHGSDHIHTPAATLNVLQACADLINEAFGTRTHLPKEAPSRREGARLRYVPESLETSSCLG